MASTSLARCLVRLDQLDDAGALLDTLEHDAKNERIVGDDLISARCKRDHQPVPLIEGTASAQ